jgi:hypothetical protein
MDITEEMVEVAARALASSHDCPAFEADDRGDFWAEERAAFRADAREAILAAAPLIAAQALRSAADDHASYDDDQVDYVGHEDRCDYGPAPCDCAKGRTARWLYRRAGKLDAR